jgi:hypothetical protein
MAFSLNINNLQFKLPWFLYDIDNVQLITTKHIPVEISDNKSIIFSETPVPGLPYSPVSYSGIGNRKLAFTLPLIGRNNTIGNVGTLKQFDNLRHEVVGFLGIFGKGQFTRNPKVLYYWGIGSVPLVYYVSKCDFSHNSLMTNNFANPKYTNVSIELILDEEDPVNKMEEAYRKIMSLVGETEGLINLPGNIL